MSFLILSRSIVWSIGSQYYFWYLTCIEIFLMRWSNIIRLLYFFLHGSQKTRFNPQTKPRFNPFLSLWVLIDIFLPGITILRVLKVMNLLVYFYLFHALKVRYKWFFFIVSPEMQMSPFVVTIEDARIFSVI